MEKIMEKIMKTVEGMEEDKQRELLEVLMKKFNIKAAKERVLVKSTKTYTRTEKQLTEKQSLPKQCMIVLNSLTEPNMTLESWTEKCLANGLETRQEPVRIVMYYRPLLISGGFVTENN